MKKMKKGKAVAAEAVTMPRFLPEEMIMNILSRLPVKSISRFRCVSKSWGDLFRNPDFIKMHLEEKKCKLLLREDNLLYSSIDYFDPSLTCYDITSIDYPFKDKENYLIEVKIVGSCNGLLCITPFHYLTEERICLWNPSTKEYKKLSVPEEEIICEVHIAYGFGYDCKMEDYKLVRILTVFDDNEPPCCEIKVYTLLSNAWKNISGTYPYEIYSHGVIVNGTLHWGAAHHTGGSRSSKSVVSFDFGSERLLEVPIPENLDDEMFINVGSLRSCLCIFSTRHHEDGFVVWVMKDYGVKESWTKLFTLVQQSLVRPCYDLIQSFNIGELLLHIESGDHNVGRKHTLVLYNPENERVRDLKIRVGVHGDWSDATTSCWSDATTYVETLVSLNTGTYLVQGRVVESKAVEGGEAYDEKEEKQEKDDVGKEQVGEPKQIETDGEKEETQEIYDVASSLLLLKHETRKN